jgi:hypothetical protein
MKNLVRALSNQLVITSLVIYPPLKMHKRKNIIFNLLGKVKKDQYFQGPCHLESSTITTHILYLSPQTTFGPLISLYPPKDFV